MSYAIARRDAGVITQPQLDGYLGKSIGAICQNGYADDHDNHCAHFVSHALGYNFGVTCQMMGNGKGPAATLASRSCSRNASPSACGRSGPSSLSTCLVFMTRASNVNLAGKVMSQRRRANTSASIFERVHLALLE